MYNFSEYQGFECKLYRAGTILFFEIAESLGVDVQHISDTDD